MSTCSNLGDSDNIRGTLGNAVGDEQYKQVQVRTIGFLVKSPRQIFIGLFLTMSLLQLY